MDTLEKARDSAYHLEMQAPTPDALKTSSGNRPEASIGKNRRILVVDDNLAVLRATETKLRASGFDVVTASEGSVAINTATILKPDLIVLDINFPPDLSSISMQWDGLKIMRWLKRYEDLAHIPVVVITGADASNFGDQALQAGAAAFFHKPIDYVELMATILQLIQQKSG